MEIATIVSRGGRAAKRIGMIALAAVVLATAVVPTLASADSPPVHISVPLDGSGDNPQMP